MRIMDVDPTLGTPRGSAMDTPRDPKPPDKPNSTPTPTPTVRDALRAMILDRFTRAFGPPELADDKDMLWRLRARHGQAPINVLVNGASDHAVAWIFDPTDISEGVVSEVICDETAAARMASVISLRVQRARASGI
jgi:hypothetical protein